jgi:hypothetical protein
LRAFEFVLQNGGKVYEEGFDRPRERNMGEEDIVENIDYYRGGCR